MSGNVSEWCWNWLSDSYASEVANDLSLKNPTGISDGSLRTLRGGSWIYSADDVQILRRDGIGPSAQHDFVGFRVCRFT